MEDFQLFDYLEHDSCKKMADINCAFIWNNVEKKQNIVQKKTFCRNDILGLKMFSF